MGQNRQHKLRLMDNTSEVIVKLSRTVLEMSLSRGETRVVYLPPRALVLGIKGHATVVERVNGLGDAGFSLCIPVRQGETHLIAYGGQVMLRAAQCSCLRVIPPQPYGAVWFRRWHRFAKALQRAASVLGRHRHAGA
jgi:hypothetical protein